MQNLNYDDIFEVIQKNVIKRVETNNLVSKDILTSYISEYINGLKHRHSDLNFSERYFSKFPIKGAVQNDYYLKIINHDPNEYLLTSLRFKGLDIDQPFLMIEETAREIHEKNVYELLTKTLQSYQTLQLENISFYSRFDLSITNKQFSIDKIIVGETIEKILESAPPSSRSVKLEACSNLTSHDYDCYEQEYLFYLSCNPVFKRELRIETLDYLNELAAKGFLYKILIDNLYAGIIAVDFSLTLSIFGLEIIEEFLFKNFRGQKLGVISQHLLAIQLSEKGYKDFYLYGSILAQNLSALNTAFGNNRVPLFYLIQFHA